MQSGGDILPETGVSESQAKKEIIKNVQQSYISKL
jgi:hypothetical protein